MTGPIDITTDQSRHLAATGELLIVEVVDLPYPDFRLEGPDWFHPIEIDNEGRECPGERQWGIWCDGWHEIGPFPAPGEVLPLRDAEGNEFRPVVVDRGCKRLGEFTVEERKATGKNVKEMLSFFYDKEDRLAWFVLVRREG